MRVPLKLTPENVAQPEGASVPPTEVAAAAKKVLIVDDNVELLGILELRLTSLGYAVIKASSGDEALDILARASDVDLLLTDVVMPGRLNGGQLASEARAIRPALKVLFTSGYFQSDLRRDGVIGPEARVLSKPYRIHELASSVSEALSA